MKVFLPLLYFFLIPLLFIPSFSFGVTINLIAPTNNETGVKTDTSFGWNAVSDPNLHHYQLEIHPKSNPVWTPLNIGLLNHCNPTKCQVGALEFANTFPLQSGLFQYEWRITAFDTNDNSLGSSVSWSFITEAQGPACPPNCPPPGGGGPGGGPVGTLKNPISAENLTDLFNKIFSFLFGLAIFIVPVIVIYAAFLMLMGGGDPEKLAKGRMILMWTAIAFIIILLSRGLPIVFKNLL